MAQFNREKNRRPKAMEKEHTHTLAKALIKSVRKRHIYTYKHTQKKHTNENTHMSTSTQRQVKEENMCCAYIKISMVFVVVALSSVFSNYKKKSFVVVAVVVVIATAQVLPCPLCLCGIFDLDLLHSFFYQQPFASITAHNVFTFFSLHLGMP